MSDYKRGNESGITHTHTHTLPIHTLRAMGSLKNTRLIKFGMLVVLLTLLLSMKAHRYASSRPLPAKCSPKDGTNVAEEIGDQRINAPTTSTTTVTTTTTTSSTNARILAGVTPPPGQDPFNND
jgi:hypothetical protein